MATRAIGAPGHSWRIAAQGKMPAAQKGMVHAAKIMAGTAVDLFTNETPPARARKDHRERTERVPDVRPIPADVKPPLQPRPAAA